MPSRETFEALTSDEFISGLVLGLVALCAGLLVVVVRRRSSSKPAPVVGVLLVGAALAALRSSRELPSDLWLGLAMLAAGGALYPWARRIPLLPTVLAVPGAWWVTQVVDLPGAAWVPWLLFGWIAVGADLVSSFDQHFASRGYGPILLAISIAGMFAALPDTEQILVVLGAALPIALLAWPRTVCSLGAIGAYSALGLLAWTTAWGGRGREASVIGAAACLGLLAIEPLVRRLRGHGLADRTGRVWPVFIAQAVVVGVVARGPGLAHDLRSASLAVVGVAALVAIALQFVPPAADRQVQ